MERGRSEITVPLTSFVGTTQITLFLATGIASDEVHVNPCWNLGVVPPVKALYATTHSINDKVGLLVRIIFDSPVSNAALCLGLKVHQVDTGIAELLAYRETNEWELLCTDLPEDLTREKAVKDFYLDRKLPDAPSPCARNIASLGLVLAGEYRTGRSRNHYWHYAAHDPTSENHEYDHAVEISKWAENEVEKQDVTVNRRSQTTGTRGLHVVGIYDRVGYGWHFYFGNGEGRVVVGTWRDGARTFLRAGETWRSNWGYAPQYQVRNEGGGDFPIVTLITDI